MRFKVGVEGLLGWLLVVLLLALVFAVSFGWLPVHAATLKVRAVAPDLDNGGSCTAPVLIPRSDSCWVHFQWISPSRIGEDSVRAAAGQPVALTVNVPPGIYTIRSWASDVGGAGCDTSATVRTLQPWKPKV